MIALPFVYTVAGLVFTASALLAAFDRARPRHWVNAAFWALLALSMLAGDRLGDLGNGVLVIALVGVVALGKLGPASASAPEAERQECATRHGNRLFALAPPSRRCATFESPCSIPRLSTAPRRPMF